jgi:hypothetical protein
MAIVRSGIAVACAVLTTCVAFSQGTLVVASALSFLAVPPRSPPPPSSLPPPPACAPTRAEISTSSAPWAPVSYVVLLGAAFWIGAGVSFLFAKRHERAAEDRGGAIAPIGPPAGQNKSEVKSIRIVNRRLMSRETHRSL